MNLFCTQMSHQVETFNRSLASHILDIAKDVIDKGKNASEQLLDFNELPSQNN